MELEYILKKEVNIEGSVVSKGHTIFSLPVVSIKVDESTSVLKPYEGFKKPDGNGYYRLSGWENGGGVLTSGEAEIVCGLQGEKLTPKFIKRKGDNLPFGLACGKHALFVGEGLCSVKVIQCRKDYSIEITEYIITNQVDGSTRAKILWKAKLGLINNLDEFIANDLPSPYRDFGPAIKAAMEKAQHYHCREPHFCDMVNK
jgi:hypothetical protein